ncbi:probable extracellular repeat, HAF family, partial [Nitrosospira sp. Nsp14]|uniref:hypothetical protein n=1 Tax=Nitrosospira sp. Nsp14 TaxID=1855333 RepID=UPI0008EFD7B5
VNIIGSQKATIFAQVGQFYSGSVGQYYSGANMKQKYFNNKFQSLLTSSLLLIGSVQAAPLYVFTDLGSGTGMRSEAYSINNSGQVVGVSWSNSSQDNPRPMLWYNGTTTDLNAADGLLGGAYGINDSGSIAGYQIDGQASEAVIWNETTKTIFPVRNNFSSHSDAMGINNLGDIVGSSFGAQPDDPMQVPPNIMSAALWSNGVFTDLQAFQGAYFLSLAYRINDSQQVVGFSVIPTPGSTNNESSLRATLWDHGAVVDLGAQGGGFLGGSINGSIAADINNSGHIVGTSLIASGWDGPTEQRATLWVGTTIIDLGTWGGRESASYAINDVGQIVGFSWGVGPILYENGIAINLNTLFDSAALGTEWTLIPNDINDNGAIVGRAYNTITGQLHAFLLTPEPVQPAEIVAVSAPETYTLVLLGAVILAFNRSRRTYFRKTIHGSLHA